MRLSGLALVLVTVLVAGLGGGAGSAWAGGPNRPVLPPAWSWPPSKQLQARGTACLGRLDAAGLRWVKGARTKKVATPITLPVFELGGVAWRSRIGASSLMDCFLAEALLVHAAPALHGLGVRTVVFGSIYKFRNVSGKRLLSRHALGLAMDIYSFITEDGVEHVVEKAYPRGDVVLRDIERALIATHGFRNVLTPATDPGEHDDHFHIEALTPLDHVATPAPQRRLPARLALELPAAWP
ncbi:MAG: extensin family protein [Deltaproteobacteria bacterium]|nr:extensin family protein [Deltaproteobacteria bacterium]